VEAAQTGEDFVRALEEAKGLIPDEWGIREVGFIEDGEGTFWIDFIVSNPPFGSFRPSHGWGLGKKAAPWTAEEIVAVIADFAVRVRS
jgi:hypothetical protein